LKIIVVLMIVLVNLFANGFSVRYNVNMGMLGSVGYVDLSLDKNRSAYEMKLVATTTGLAATLTDNRVESYYSHGKIIDGIYIPHTYIKTKTTKTKKFQYKYIFDHVKKSITEFEDKHEDIEVTHFDALSISLKREKIHKHERHEKKLDTYRRDDVLTAYINNIHNCQKLKQNVFLVAVGAHNEKNKVTLSCLKGVEKISAIKALDANLTNMYKIKIDYFKEDDTDVNIVFGTDGSNIITKALLGEIFWVGKVTAELEKEIPTLNE